MELAVENVLTSMSSRYVYNGVECKGWIMTWIHNPSCLWNTGNRHDKGLEDKQAYLHREVRSKWDENLLFLAEKRKSGIKALALSR